MRGAQILSGLTTDPKALDVLPWERFNQPGREGVLMSDLAGQFAAVGVELVHVRGEAVDIRRPDGGRVQVVTDVGLTVEADHIVLCCGNLQSREYSGFETTQGFYANPYPIRRLARAATSKSSVAIWGARLSAIDVALGLAGSGFRGSMTMFSRSGYFPSVRGTQGRYVPTILTEDRLRAHHEKYGAIRLAQVLEWTMEELALAGSPTPALSQLPPPPPGDVAEFFEKEIAAACSDRPWQAVLYATNTVIDYLWQILHEDDRAEFMERYAASWMSYRVSIPAENAARILELSRSGQLAFRSGAAQIEAQSDGIFRVTTKRDRNVGCADSFDMVVGAFGTPRNAALLDSRLVQSLLVSGFARAHRHGGVEVDPLTGALIDQGGRICGDVSALGELTSGVHFFTSVLEINARHAARMAKRVLQAPRALKHDPALAFASPFASVAATAPLQPAHGLQQGRGIRARTAKTA